MVWPLKFQWQCSYLFVFQGYRGEHNPPNSRTIKLFAPLIMSFYSLLPHISYFLAFCVFSNIGNVIYDFFRSRIHPKWKVERIIEQIIEQSKRWKKRKGTLSAIAFDLQHFSMSIRDKTNQKESFLFCISWFFCSIVPLIFTILTSSTRRLIQNAFRRSKIRTQKVLCLSFQCILKSQLVITRQSPKFSISSSKKRLFD